jgi:glycosyltransferase involved in cell wall biosynthesis
MLQGEPPELRLAFSEELAREIQKLADRVDFDIVQIEHGSMGMYLEALPARLRRRAVWVLHDIDFDKFMRIAHIERRTDTKIRAWIHAMMMRRWQPHFASYFGLCVTMSEADRRLLLSANSSLRVEVSPNGVDTKHYRPLPEEGDTAEMLFIGNMGYQPNVDAAVYFCHEVLPLIRRRVSDTKLWIVGISPGASVMRLGGNGVSVTGGVPDVVPYYMRSKVCVVPLRAGGGTRLKILEAMALGRAVVSTSMGCEGLDVVDGEHILIADDSKLFAEQIVKLLTDNELRARIAAKAREFVVASYDWDVIVEKLMNDFDGMARQERNGECQANQQMVDRCR